MRRISVLGLAAVLLLFGLNLFDVLKRQYILAAGVPGQAPVTNVTQGFAEDMVWFEFRTRAGLKSSGYTYVGVFGGSGPAGLVGRTLPIHYCEGHDSSLLSWAALDDDLHFSLERSLLGALLLLLLAKRARQN